MIAESRPLRAESGLYLYAIARARSSRSRARLTEASGVSLVRYRELHAIVRPVPFALPHMTEAELREHQRVVEAVMRRGTVLPLPWGVVFRGRRELIRLLDDQYLAIEEALAFIDGHWEVRVHMGVNGLEEATPELRDLAAHVYAELRRMAHAAQSMPPRQGRLLSAAFLVQRGGWVEFVERGEDLAAADPRLTLDITGPWPAYDFVRLIR